MYIEHSIPNLQNRDPRISHSFTLLVCCWYKKIVNTNFQFFVENYFSRNHQKSLKNYVMDFCEILTEHSTCKKFETGLEMA